jgi:hypothetical protein
LTSAGATRLQFLLLAGFLALGVAAGSHIDPNATSAILAAMLGVAAMHLAVLHDLSWFAGTLDATTRAGMRGGADTSSPVGAYQYTPVFDTDAKAGSDEMERPGIV